MILDRLQHVFRKVFMNPALEIDRTTSAKDIPAWDSLTHLELIATIEEVFAVQFTFEEVMHFGNVGDIVELILKKKND